MNQKLFLGEAQNLGQVTSKMDELEQFFIFQCGRLLFWLSQIVKNKFPFFSVERRIFLFSTYKIYQLIWKVILQMVLYYSSDLHLIFFLSSLGVSSPVPSQVVLLGLQQVF